VYIALALVNEPEVVFLNELTTGPDPQARRSMWDLVRNVRQQGTTVFLTTHLMGEAERLSDRVAVIDRGHARGHVPRAHRARDAGLSDAWALGAERRGDEALHP
jgi:ABC-type multidrug transport system ATPase subunit